MRQHSLVLLACLWIPPATAAELTVSGEVLLPPGSSVVEESAALRRIEILVPAGSTKVPVEMDFLLTYRPDACVADPASCDGGERAPSGGCRDGDDDDGDGRVDGDDADCLGVQGFLIVAGTDPSFHLREVTRSGTVSDDHTNPPGIANEFLGFFGAADPARNDGQEGVVASMAFSLTEPVALYAEGTWPVVKFRGELDVSGLAPGETSAPCRVDLRGPGEVGLTGRGGPPGTSTITVQGQTAIPELQDLELVVRVLEPAPFRRGDSNDDGKLDISDVLRTLGYLFLGSPAPSCLDSADTDDNGTLEITDPLAVFGFLFIGSQIVPAPGPSTCGADPTPDELHCATFTGC
jgi:hypothetical protein